MDQGELRLREFKNTDSGTIRTGDRVKLYSEYFDQVFSVEVTHSHGQELGGDVLETDDEDPMLGRGSIIHFRPDHVLEVLPTEVAG